MNTNDIAYKNFLLDIKSFFKENFINSYKGLFIIAAFSIYKIKNNIHNIKYLKTNSTIPLHLINKNKTIRVKPSIRCVIHDPEIKDENNITLSFRHYPKYNPFKPKPQKGKTNMPSTEIDAINIHLACIDTVSNEGVHLLKSLIDKNKTFYLTFNHIQYHDTTRLYCWVLYKEYFRMNNLNVMLVSNGLARVGNVKSNDIYDEMIYYYHSDIIDAEEDAKMRSVGLWRSMKTPMSSSNPSTFGKLFSSIKRNLNMRKWEKVVLKK
jgi:endonuclease YncB( thermonuclease family)